jgi:hypothetical protein
MHGQDDVEDVTVEDAAVAGADNVVVVVGDENVVVVVGDENVVVEVAVMIMQLMFVLVIVLRIMLRWNTQLLERIAGVVEVDLILALLV